MLRFGRVDEPELEFERARPGKSAPRRSPRTPSRMERVMPDRDAPCRPNRGHHGGSKRHRSRRCRVAWLRRGCHLALADVNEAGLAETAQLVRTSSLLVTEHRLDVSNRDAIAKFPAEIAAAHPRVDLLVNNAGVAVGGTFEQVTEEDFDWLLSINFFGVVRMTRSFLPVLKQSDDACIVNLSSVFGLVAPPGQAAYVASKFAVRGFSSLFVTSSKDRPSASPSCTPAAWRRRLRRMHAVPGGYDAAEVERRRAAFDKHLRLPASVAGETIVRGIEEAEAARSRRQRRHCTLRSSSASRPSPIGSCSAAPCATNPPKALLNQP